MERWPNPLIPGFNPDPSIVAVDGAYYLATSTFEYLPALPIYRSTDLRDWTLIGNVATRAEQVGIENAPTPGGVWAPTIRHRDGVFYVIVSLMFDRRCLLFSTTDPAGPWSDPVTIPGVQGIDPDLAWGDDGTAYVTYAVVGDGIWQATVDLTTGETTTDPRPLWAGSGLYAPEGPHLYERDGWWYLLLAEGGTERGHAVTVARGNSPAGPFEGFAGNPVLSARSTGSHIQNLGHADLFTTPDGGTAVVLLGVRPIGFTKSFSPLGRETFITDVDWVDGWPIPRPVELAEHDIAPFVADFGDPSALEDPAWISVRRLPSEIGAVHADAATLSIASDGSDLSHVRPAFIGRRQRALSATTSVLVDSGAGTGGLAARNNEKLWFALQATTAAGVTTVTAIATLAGLQQTWEHEFAAGDVELRFEMRELPREMVGIEVGGDRIRLVAARGDDEVVLAELDGRYWSFETSESFTGRVIGMYAVAGEVRFSRFTSTTPKERA